MKCCDIDCNSGAEIYECYNTDRSREIWKRWGLKRCCPERKTSRWTRIKKRHGCDFEYFFCRCPFFISIVLLSISFLLCIIGISIKDSDYKYWESKVDRLNVLRRYIPVNTQFSEVIDSSEYKSFIDKSNISIITSPILNISINDQYIGSSVCILYPNQHQACSYVCYTRDCWVPEQTARCSLAMRKYNCVETYFDKTTYRCNSIDKTKNFTFEDELNICRLDCPDFSCQGYNYKCGSSQCLMYNHTLYNIAKYRVDTMTRSEFYITKRGEKIYLKYKGEVCKVSRKSEKNETNCKLKSMTVMYDPEIPDDFLVLKASADRSLRNGIFISPPKDDPIYLIPDRTINLYISSIFFLVLAISILGFPLYCCTRDYRRGTLYEKILINTRFNKNIIYIIMEYSGNEKEVQSRKEWMMV